MFANKYLYPINYIVDPQFLFFLPIARVYTFNFMKIKTIRIDTAKTLEQYVTDFKNNNYLSIKKIK